MGYFFGVVWGVMVGYGYGWVGYLMMPVGGVSVVSVVYHLCKCNYRHITRANVLT